MADTTPDPVLCANEHIHRARIKAVAEISFPDGTFRATTACAGCLNWSVREARTGVYPILIEPIGPAS